MSAQETAAVVRRFVEEVINQGNMDSADRFVWEDVVEQVPLPGQGLGLEGLKGILRGHAVGLRGLELHNTGANRGGR